VTTWLAALAARLGAAPREPSEELREAAHLPALPEWLEPPDALYAAVTQHDLLLAEGRLALGYLFMANSVLFEPGDSDAPAGAVYSFDPVVHRFPDKLERTGGRLFAFHGDTGAPVDDPWLRATEDSLRTGFERPMHERVPPEMADGHALFHTSVMVYRDHLPSGQLTDGLVPLLVAPRGTEPRTAIIVPGPLWPAPWRAQWEKGSGS